MKIEVLGALDDCSVQRLEIILLWTLTMFSWTRFAYELRSFICV